MNDHGVRATDAHDLATYGYQQRLSRSLGSFSSFAAGFSYISILTGMFQLFGFGYGFAGPGLFWAWLFVLAGQFCVALCFSELGARFPIAGSVYTWSKHISGRVGSFFSGWTMLIGSIISVAAVSIAMQVVLPKIWSGFQVFDKNAANAVFLGCCTIAVTTALNVAGVKVISRVNNVGVAAELVGVVLVIAMLALQYKRGPGVVVTTQGAGDGLSGSAQFGYFAALMMAAIMPAYVMYGFDTASSLAEETTDPRRRTPRAILQALAAAGIAGALLLLVGLMASPTLSVDDLGKGGLPQILEQALGSTAAKILLVDVAIAIFVCTLAIHTASIRIAFAMARDNTLPFGSKLAHVTAHRHVPAAPAVISGLIAALVLIVNIGNEKIFLIVTSVAIITVYMAYLLVTGPLLRRRLGGWPVEGRASGLFTMRRPVGLLVNAFAAAYGLFMIVNLLWPRTEIYGEGGYAWGGVATVAVILVLGSAVYAVIRTRAGEVTEEHRAAREDTAPAPALAPTEL
jgi:urea carboxylase system permease